MPADPTRPPPRSRRRAAGRGGEIAARAAAAIGLGYVLAALAVAVAARLLPLDREEATMAATLPAFALYAAVAVWAFAERRTWRVWALGAGAATLLAGLLWLTFLQEPRL
jgi:hypothetical protein